MWYFTWGKNKAIPDDLGNLGYNLIDHNSMSHAKNDLFSDLIKSEKCSFNKVLKNCFQTTPKIMKNYVFFKFYQNGKKII